MVAVLGLDIGGANTKAAFISTKNGGVAELNTAIEYFPFWKRNSEQLCQMLIDLALKTSSSKELNCLSVTLTAELSDVYNTKFEGVNQILNCVCEAFRGTEVFVLDVDASLRSVKQAKQEPLKVAAANWAATGWLVSQYLSDGVVVDVGSTSTSIIPILTSEVAAKGKTDLEKLMNGELVYTGILRTNVAAIVKSVPVKGQLARVSSELFALSGDVHLILQNIKPEDYTVETADGKEISRSNSLSRLARVICADTEMLSDQEIEKIAVYVYDKQIEQIAEGLSQVLSRSEAEEEEEIPVLVTGLGREILARKAAEHVGVVKILSIEDLLPKSAALSSPAVGVALMAASKLEGRRLSWKQ